MKKMLMNCAKIPLIGLTIILTGCVTTNCPTMPAKPTKPTLESLKPTSKGGITLNKADAEKLGVYIIELERGYK